MLTSVVQSIRTGRQYPELQGTRVLVSGISSERGIDIARGFAEVGSRLVVQLTPHAAAEDDQRQTTLLQVLANTATEVQALHAPLDTSDAAVRFAQRAVQAYGGLDVVVNIIAPQPDCIPHSATVDDIEDAVAQTLRSACMITRIAANRMSLTWTEGLILNAVLVPAPRTMADAAFTSMLNQTLAHMTRAEAASWASKGIRINAVKPHDLSDCGPVRGMSTSASCRAGEADIAALALHLASKRGHTLTGHIFDAEGIATRRC